MDAMEVWCDEFVVLVRDPLGLNGHATLRRQAASRSFR
jgi:hypothetical protein